MSTYLISILTTDSVLELHYYLIISIFQLCVDELLPQIFQTLSKHLEYVLLMLLFCHKLG